jgi:hypothetical protein
MRYFQIITEGELSDSIKDVISDAVVAATGSGKNIASIPISDIVTSLNNQFQHVQLAVSDIVSIAQTVPGVDHVDQENIYLKPEEHAAQEVDTQKSKEQEDADKVASLAKRAAGKDRSL